MFYLSTKIEYGLNLLIILAKSKQRISLRKISDKTGMPYRFLTKIVKLLINAELIESKEGKNGGYLLIKKPKEIKIKQVLDCLGEPMNMVHCLSRQNCTLEKGCKMKFVWQKIKKNIDKELNKITLKDLL